MKRTVVNNEEFYNELKQYLKEKNKNPELHIPEHLSELIYILIYNLTFNRKFINYTFKDLFISEAMYTCLRYIDKFDVTKYTNPFAYFTQIAYNCFLTIIINEKKQSKIKDKLWSNNTFYQPCKKIFVEGCEKKANFAPITLTENNITIEFKTQQEWDEYVQSLKQNK
jgi:DNA-directed RNA polymerase specialized sigma24 family protein